MNLPSVACEISGTDGRENSEWERKFTLHGPSLTLAEAPRLLVDAEGTASLLLVWCGHLRDFIRLGSEASAKERIMELRREEGA